MPAAFVPTVAKWIAGSAIKYFGASGMVANYIYVAAAASLYAAPAVYAQRSAARQAKKMQRALAGLREQGTTASFADPAASAKIVYGEMRVGGTTVFAHTTGVKNETLHMVIVHCLDGVSEMGEVYYGDEALLLPWNGGSPPNNPGVGSRFRDKVLVNKKAVGGAADADLVTAAPTKWTSNHKLTGLCSTYHRLTWDPDVFPQGANFNISCQIKGRACYDPRTTTTVYTTNPALILRDYLTTYVGIPSNEINDSDVIAAANICDESVTIADATTAARYTCNLVLDTADNWVDNARKILACMAGWADCIDGVWRMKAGAHETSALSLTIDDLIGEIQFQAADDVAQSCNGIRAIYLDPANNWQPADATPVIKTVTAPNIVAGTRCTILSVGSTDFTAIGAASNTVGLTFTATGAGTGTGTVDPYLGADNGVRRWKDVELYGTTNHPEARRLMRIELERARHELTVKLSCNARATLCTVGDTVDLTVARFGWTNKLFQVAEHVTRYEVEQGEGEEDPGGVFVSVDLVLREISSAIYTRESADETTADPAPNTDMQSPWDVTAPEITLVESDDDQLLTLHDGTVISRIKLTWACADPYVTSGGGFEIEYKLSADEDWLTIPRVRGSDTQAWIQGVLDGEDYDVRIRAVNGLGAKSDWGTELAHTVIGKAENPNPVTDLTASAIPGGVLLEWTEPLDKDIAAYDIYEAAVGDPMPTNPSWTVAAPATSFARIDMAAGDELDFWVKARDTSGNRSAEAGPVSAEAGQTTSPTLMYRGVFSASKFYYHNENIRNIVKQGSSYYLANNTAKDGLDTWLTPPSADWTAFASLPELVATGIILAEAGVFLDTVTVGDGTADKGRVISHGVTGFAVGTGFFLGFDGTTPKFRVGNPSGDKMQWDGSALTMTGTLTVGTGESNTTINATGIDFGTRIKLRDVSSTATLSFNGSAAQSSGNKGIKIEANSSGTTINGGDIGQSPYSPTFSITSAGAGTFASVVSNGTISATTSLTLGSTPCVLYSSSGNLRVGSTTSLIDRDVTALGFNAGASGFTATDGSYTLVCATPYGGMRLRGWDFKVETTGGVEKARIEALTGSTWLGSTTIQGALQVNTSLNVTGTMTGAQGLTLTGGSLTVAGSATVGSASSAVINWHTDCSLYRVAAGQLATDGSIRVGTTSGGGVGAYGGFAAYSTSASDYVFLASYIAGTVNVKDVPFQVVSGANVRFSVAHATGAVTIQGNQILTTRRTGWGAPTGTATRSAFATSTVTTEQLAERVKALIDDLTTHGLIGS